MEVIANVIGIAAVIVFILSYQFKTRRGIILCSGASRILYILQYVLLGAFTGAVFDIVGVFTTLLADKKDKPFIKKYLVPVFILSNLAVVGIGILLYKNAFDLLPMFGILFETGALWLNNEKHIRIVSFFGAPCWLIYNLSTVAYGSAIGNVFTMISIIIAFIRYDIKKVKVK